MWDVNEARQRQKQQGGIKLWSCRSLHKSVNLCFVVVIGADSSLYMFFQNADMEWPLRGDLHRFSFYLD